MHSTSLRTRAPLARLLAPAAIITVSCITIGAAQAEVTVVPAARGFDIDVSDQATSTELLDAITSATGVKIEGAPEDAAIGANHLRSASLERALRTLMPRAGFVVRSRGDGTPEAIIFLSTPLGGDPDGAPSPVPVDPAAGNQQDAVPIPPDTPIPDGTIPDGPIPDGTNPDAPIPDGSADQPEVTPPDDQDGSGG